MSAERIASLEAQLAEAQATIRDQARALEENARRERERDALRIEQERETERQRILRRERNARHRAARRQGDASETPARRSGDVSETSHPSFSSPPLDGPPLSSQTHLSPPLYPLPASSSPLSGLADARPPDAGTKPVTPTSDDLPESAPNDVTEAAGGVESGPIPPLDSPIPHSASLPGQGANPSGSPNGSSSAGPPPWPPVLRLEAQAAPPEKRAPQARKAARKVVDGEKPPDPRHAPLVKALCDAFLEFTGAAYAFSGRSAKTVTALLLQADCAPDTRGASAHDAVLQRWRWGLGWEIPLSRRRPVQTLEQLLQHWNELAQEPPKPEVPRNPNAPTAGACEWDWTGAATGKEAADA